jgi:hypothetical protein
LKRWLKWTAVTSIAAVALMVAFILVEHLRGRWLLNRRLAALESRGETLSAAALEPKRPPDDQNRAAALTALSNRFRVILTNSAFHPPSLRFAAPGRAIVTAKLSRWGGEGQATHDWEDVRGDIEPAQDVLASLRAGADRPAYDSGFDYRRGFVDFQLGAVVNVKQAVQCLHLATLFDLHEGRQGAAHANLCALVKLAVGQKPEPLVICQLVRQACLAIAFNVTWQALQFPGWTEDQLVALQSAWSSCDLPGDMGRAFEMERALSLDFYRQIGASRAALDRVIRERADSEWTALTGPLPTTGFWLHYLHLPLWRVAWIDQDALRSLEQWDVMIERERLVRAKSWSALPGRLPSDGAEESLLEMGLFAGREQLGWYDRLRYLFSAESFSITGMVLRKTLSLQTQQQMVLAAIAVARHRLAEGKEPPSVEALVPRYLPALPRDWMNGETLRYQLRPDGGFLLYSVGEDGRDDHGDPAPGQVGKKYRLIGDGRDAVWPTAATAEEMEAAMKAGTAR